MAVVPKLLYISLIALFSIHSPSSEAIYSDSLIVVPVTKSFVISNGNEFIGIRNK